jgi:hypothetical protein
MPERLRLSGAQAAYLVATVFAVVFLSALGILLGALGVLHGFYEGSKGWMAVCGALAAIALGLELARL